MDFNEMKALSSKIKKESEEKYNNSSKDRLEKIVSKKIDTTMIGALSALEDKMGFLWCHGSREELSETEQVMRELYEELRSVILDLGNKQKRNINEEFSQYDIHWNRYHMDLVLKEQDNG